MTVQRRSACFFFIWGCKHKAPRRLASNLEMCAPSHLSGQWRWGSNRAVLGEQWGRGGHTPAADRETREIPEPHRVERVRRAERCPNRGSLSWNERRG